ncbi:fimbrial protein [Providencia alcalifaciens]|uniref:fimbrial protein n=1 Tax=Providencia alcalifaciens TaxID=126385 RepID=UPI001CE09845|nr:fimbrial protein [Providencia alcalifaciens]UBX47795.1 fimbrial protein [Providencia alcalifaciens]
MKQALSVSCSLSMLIFLIFLCFGSLRVAYAEPMTLKAVIASRGIGCEINLLERVLEFKALQASKLVGAIQAYQIKPLTLQISCVDETEVFQPILSLQGSTPYPNDTLQTVFLDGAPNGIGFMVRQSVDNQAISLADFYRPDLAIRNHGDGVPIQILDISNQYHSNTLLWVGVVGPLQPEITSGRFQAALTVNVAFE